MSSDQMPARGRLSLSNFFPPGLEKTSNARGMPMGGRWVFELRFEWYITSKNSLFQQTCSRRVAFLVHCSRTSIPNFWIAVLGLFVLTCFFPQHAQADILNNCRSFCLGPFPFIWRLLSFALVFLKKGFFLMFLASTVFYFRACLEYYPPQQQAF